MGLPVLLEDLGWHVLRGSTHFAVVLHHRAQRVLQRRNMAAYFAGLATGAVCNVWNSEHHAC